MFNPTVIRLCTIGDQTGLIIANRAEDDYYFQVYKQRENDHTYLAYAMPWGSQVKALADFEDWVSFKSRFH